MAYAVATTVRKICSMITADLESDADIAARSTIEADVIIDSRLSEQGAPFTSPSTMINLVASLLVVAQIFDDKLADSDLDEHFGTRKRKMALELLEGIASGKYASSCVTAPQLLGVADDTERASDEMFTTTKDYNWQARDEEREDA